MERRIIVKKKYFKKNKMETPKSEQFRDSIGTINEEGKRSWVFPKKPSGKFYKYRS